MADSTILPKRSLTALLLEKGIVTPATLQKAEDILSKEGFKSRNQLLTILVDQFNVNRDALFAEVAQFYTFRTVDISKDSTDDGVLTFIRKELQTLPLYIRELAVENKVLPWKADKGREGRLIIITPDPTNPGIYNIARAFSNKKFEICYTPLSMWEELWTRVSIDKAIYKDKETELRDQGFINEDEEENEKFEQAIEEEISRSGLVNLVESIFVDAVRVGASDIHVVPRSEKTTEFFFRVDGRLSRWYSHTETRAEAVAAVVKDRAKNLDRFERNTAQDGFAQLMIDKKTIRFRVSVIPLVGHELKNKFESIVIRILRETSIDIRLDQLGFDRYSEEQVRRAIAKPHGIVIVTGPTGSGKSTTLVAALRSIMDPSLNILTVEDPVEYFIEGARQVKLNPKLDFEDALRAILRHDPDIVMVGEMRDKITAEIAIKLANTGHLTLSTLHTNDAPSAVSRLFKMGVEPFLIAYSVNIVLAQRLLRKLCPRCKAKVRDVDVPVMKKLGLTEEEIASTTFYRPVGCIDCLKGYKGRTAIHEALYFTKDVRQLILDAGDTVHEEALRQAALRNGMVTLRERALTLLKDGITSIDEVTSATSED
ncbi:MAG: type II/IV secretion system protein [Bacteroidetes bacterium]|nr:MAG: type II/IV secretion system protein [Bacteroidota bacterium]